MTAEQVRSALSRLRLRPETAGIMLNAPVRTIQRWRKEGAKGPVVRLLELYHGIGPKGPRVGTVPHKGAPKWRLGIQHCDDEPVSAAGGEVTTGSAADLRLHGACCQAWHRARQDEAIMALRTMGIEA